MGLFGAPTHFRSSLKGNTIMSHYFEVNGIREKIFILQSLALSGENFSKEYAVGCREKPSLYSQKDYWLSVKSLVSNYILEISVKVRNASESVGATSEGVEATGVKIDRGIKIYCVENKEVTRHDFLWLSNKVIHAKGFELVPVGSMQYSKPLEWWDGEIRVYGKLNGGNKWDISFSVVDWVKSCLVLVNKIESDLIKLKSNSADLQRCI